MRKNMYCAKMSTFTVCHVLQLYGHPLICKVSVGHNEEGSVHKNQHLSLLALRW